MTSRPSCAAGLPIATTSLAAAADGVRSYRDALLLSCSARMVCTILISEDMHDGIRFGNITVAAPFAARRPSPRLDTLPARN